jgi:hypothetical protein
MNRMNADWNWGRIMVPKDNLGLKSTPNWDDWDRMG